MKSRTLSLHSKTSSINLEVIPGHFATRNSHINYYLDITKIRVRQNEAKAAAARIVQDYKSDKAIDTIVCLDGTEIIGAFLAERLSETGFVSRHYNDAACIITPEMDQMGQFFFRSNIVPMIKGKNIIILMASVTTGITIKQALDCIGFYGGNVSGVSAVFSMLDEFDGLPIYSIFHKKDIPDYCTYNRHDCPYCRHKIPVDALVNGNGYSEIKHG